MQFSISRNFASNGFFSKSLGIIKEISPPPITFYLTQWLSRIPKGFRNFFPKEKGGKVGDIPKNSNPFKFNSKNKKGSGSGGGESPKTGGNPQIPGVAWGLLALPLAFMLLSPSDGDGGSEITMQDFVSQILETGQVKKITVNPDTNKAIVSLK